MKSKHSHISRALALLFLLFSMHSCIKEEFDPDKLDLSLEFSPGVALPLGYVHYQLDKLLEDSADSKTIKIDDDGLITIVYSQELVSFRADELISISDVSFSSAINNNTGFPIDLSVVPDRQTLGDTVVTSLSMDAAYAEIDSIQVESMDIIIGLSSTHNLNGNLEITSPDIVRGSTQWRVRMPLDQSTLNSTLEGYTIKLSHNTPDVNQVQLIFTIEFNRSSGVIANNETILNVNIQMQNTDYSALFGYLGQHEIDMDSRSVPIDFFDYIVEGTFHFAEPELKLVFDNSYGLPVQIIMEDFAVISDDNGRTEIVGSGVPSATNPLVINYPSLSQVGESVKDSIVMDELNTNLFTAMEQSPTSLSYGVEGLMNPDGNDHNNFLTDSSKFKVRADLSLPLHGYADFALVLDTINFDFENFYENPPEEIKRLAFRINSTNGFPVNIYMQGYFMDGNYTVLDSMFTDVNDEGRIITAASDTDGDGKVDPFENEPVEVEFTREKIDNISGSKYLILHGRLNTTNYEQKENVKIYASYYLDAHIGIIGDLEVNTAEY